ncbi:MAG: glycosyl hydrolase-related protein, partial [bacterium]|nr:glycosyl hydrolase-related protein [bacterium]
GGIKRATVLFIPRDVPALGYEVYRVVAADRAPATSTLQTNQVTFITADVHVDVLENEFFRVEIDSWNGAIRSLYDKRAQWEVINTEQPFGNTVVRELDNGNFWEYNGHCKGDALYPMNREHPLPPEGDGRAAFSHHYGGDGRVSRGHARLDYRVNFPFGRGSFATRVRLYAGLPRIDIHTTLINEDERVRYRMALPTNLPQGTITQEIPFGAIDRPTGEFPAQNWMDYSDADRGLALLNRGLPGNNVDQGVMLLSLLKATALKEGYGESGGFSKSTKTTDGYELGVTHEFDYALVPHQGDWRDAKICRRGMEFNRPLLGLKATRHEGPLPQRFSLIEVDGDSLAVSTVRDTPAGMVVRVYETGGRARTGAQLRFAFPLLEACETNLIEQEARPLPCPPGSQDLVFDITPFEIKTFRVVLRRSPG